MTDPSASQPRPQSRAKQHLRAGLIQLGIGVLVLVGGLLIVVLWNQGGGSTRQGLITLAILGVSVIVVVKGLIDLLRGLLAMALERRR